MNHLIPASIQQYLEAARAGLCTAYDSGNLDDALQKSCAIDEIQCAFLEEAISVSPLSAAQHEGNCTAANPGLFFAD